MKTNVRTYLIIAFSFGVILMLAAINAGASVPANKSVQYDTASEVDVRTFSSKELSAYRHSPDFQYERKSVDKLSWWDRIKQWFWQKLADLINVGTSTGAGKLILILLVIAVAIFVVIKMAGIDKVGFLEKKNEGLSLSYMMENDIYTVDFEREINAAIGQNNFRLAVRLWYLKTLKRLADKELIQWKPGKTNHEYVIELGRTQYAHDFIRLTNDFEYCWYGEMPVASSEYEMLKDQFTDFNQQLP